MSRLFGLMLFVSAQSAWAQPAKTAEPVLLDPDTAFKLSARM